MIKYFFEEFLSADEVARAGTLLSESSSIDLGMSLGSVKLDIEWKFFRDTNLSSINEESCSTTRRRRTNQLLGLGSDVIWTTEAVFTGHYVVGRHAERMRLPFNNFCRGYRSAEEEETVIQFLCQCPSLATCRYRLFGSPFLVSLTELSSFWLVFQCGVVVLWCAALALTNFFLFPDFGEIWSV